MNKQQQFDALSAWVQATRNGENRAIRIVGEPWSDDHILCCTVALYHEPMQQEVKIRLWWIGWEGVAALKYADESRQARIDLCEILNSTLEGLKEDIDDGNIEDDNREDDDEA